MLLNVVDSDQNQKTSTNAIISLLMKIVAVNFNNRKSIKNYLKTDEGWLNFTIGIKTKIESVTCAIDFKDGKVKILKYIPENAEATLVFKNDKSVKKLLMATPTDQIYMILRSDLYIEGSMGWFNIFFFLISVLMRKKQVKSMAKERKADTKKLKKELSETEPDGYKKLIKRKDNKIQIEKVDLNVKHLADPFISEYSLKDFPRLQRFLEFHLNAKPELCPELPKLVTQWYKEHGFEIDKDGKPWEPILRKSYSYKYLMENRSAIIDSDYLIAGTTTSKKVGVPVMPDGSGILLWNELFTIPHRTFNPFDVDEETRNLFHFEIFPFWSKRNFSEWVRDKYNNPLCQQIDERYAMYFSWKRATISHTIPDFPEILTRGTSGMIQEIKSELEIEKDNDKIAVLEAMVLTLEGLTVYSKNLSKVALEQSRLEHDIARSNELARLSEICEKVVENPAETLDEAVNAIWITWVGLHMESMNAGLSLGRLDQILQPYFEADMNDLEGEDEKNQYIKKSIELIGHFFMRCTDHFPCSPDIGNFYFGGSSSVQAITLGGVTPDGKNAVNDMTYIFLKVTEMLSLRDPNVNARYMPEVNSKTYILRLCDVNLITAGTPSLHNDKAVMASLLNMGYKLEDVRDWSSTGCVEPTLSGKHFGHTNMQMMNMVAALEMAMNDGTHPLTEWKLGPEIGSFERGDFKTFDDFFDAFTKQFKFLIDKSIEFNHMLGEAHQYIRPTPLLSSLIQGCTEKRVDVTKGGAKYNSSGSAIIGLADVTDSMMVIKRLLYDEQKISFKELKEAINANFDNNPALLAMVKHKVDKFGSDSSEAVDMANRIAKWSHDYYESLPHYRDGKYTTGFWTMSLHVAFGTLTGALPSGRLAGKPFTPGLTPQPDASNNLLDNLRDVAKLDPVNLNNNIAFNVRIVPSMSDKKEKIIHDMYSYVKTYFSLGGIQMQMNVVSSEMLKDAMIYPENYQNLIVRISGYNAYFTTLNKDMQLELIERAEYGL